MLSSVRTFEIVWFGFIAQISRWTAATRADPAVNVQAPTRAGETITPLRADACKIEFALHYEFTNIILEKLIGPVFNHIANTFVESFVKRADQRYGKT